MTLEENWKFRLARVPEELSSMVRKAQVRDRRARMAKDAVSSVSGRQIAESL